MRRAAVVVNDGSAPAVDPVSSSPAFDSRRSAETFSPALFRWFPELRERLAWVPLGRYPTPVERLRVQSVQGGLFIKRDDLTGEPYGGNKLRKLEFILAEAQKQGAERLITVGAAGSHHALATTLYGRSLGFKTTLVLFPQPLTAHVRDVVTLDHALGAELRFVPLLEAIPAGVLAARIAHRKERCYVVAPGGSDPLGTLGYVSAGLELAEQVSAGLLPPPDTIHVSAGTLGTAVGIVLGLQLAGMRSRVVATRIAGRLVTNAWAARRLARRTATVLRGAGELRVDADAALSTLTLTHRQIGRGYGHPTIDSRRAVEVFRELGIVLDTTYTAKAAVSFLDEAQYDASGSTHLFWHTLSSTTPTVSKDSPGLGSLPARARRYLGLPSRGCGEGQQLDCRVGATPARW
jgi:D-cysteine desulfhydrase